MIIPLNEQAKQNILTEKPQLYLDEKKIVDVSPKFAEEKDLYNF